MKVIDYHSLELQDKFTYLLLGHIQNGSFLDVSGGNPTHGSNTYVFEHYNNWSGVAVDVLDFGWNTTIRPRSRFFQCDATSPAFTQLLIREFQPKQIVDYLSFDVDCAGTNLGDLVLPRILDSGLSFKVITLEHEFYSQGEKVRKPTREALSALGYHLLFGDVLVEPKGRSFEDWWVHPNHFSPKLLRNQSFYLCYSDCVKKLEAFYSVNSNE